MINKLKNYKQQAKIATGILNKKVLTGPWSVQIDLTNQCNNDCLACWCRSPLLKDKAMKPEVVKQSLPYKKVIELIDEFDKLDVRDIYFTGGGEPFLHPRILDIMRYIKNKGIHLDMSTNFTLVTKKVAEQLVDIGIDHMNLSFWAATPESYAKNHPNKTSKTFKKMVEMAKYIKQLKSKKGTDKPRLGSYNVITTHNAHEVDKMLELAYEIKLDDIDFIPVDTVPDRTDSLVPTKQQRKEMAKKFKKFPEIIPVFERKYNHHVMFKNYDQFLRRIENINAKDGNYDTDILNSLPSCYAGWTFARVLATGDVNSCLKSFKIPVGNIHKQSFTEIWFGAKEEEFRKHTIDYDKTNSYFKDIGNDRATASQGCYKCCDNLGFNLLVHKKISTLGKVKKQILKTSSIFLK